MFLLMTQAGAFRAQDMLCECPGPRQGGVVSAQRPFLGGDTQPRPHSPSVRHAPCWPGSCSLLPRAERSLCVCVCVHVRAGVHTRVRVGVCMPVCVRVCVRARGHSRVSRRASFSSRARGTVSAAPCILHVYFFCCCCLQVTQGRGLPGVVLALGASLPLIP